MAITKIAILGSTGSIGKQTLDIIRTFPEKFKVLGLSGGNNSSLLRKQIAEFKPPYIYHGHRMEGLNKVQFLSMEEIASHPDAELVVIATTGNVGLAATLAAVRAGKKVALANKEVLAMAGRIITAESKVNKAKLLPVDSEHSAIWQCLRGEKNSISRVVLTASGGPFYKYPKHKLATVTVEDALKHPTWQMGRKVTIDSATLMNKGLEVIEAHWLFSLPIDKIEIVIHTKSIVHSMVEFVDGSIKAQLSVPDMRLPIQYALSYPERLHNLELKSLDFTQINSLIFQPVNYKQYPCLSLAIEAGRQGGTYPTVICAADEIAVDMFLSRQIKFTDIPKIIAATMDLHRNTTDTVMENILTADVWARKTALQVVAKRRSC